ncbi:MAG: hypothetical protein ABR592_12585 [Nitriliruptorales bacterium]
MDSPRLATSQHGLTGVVLQRDWEVGKAHRVDGTPSAVLITPQGSNASPAVAGPEAIRALVDHAAGSAQLPPIVSHPRPPLPQLRQSPPQQRPPPLPGSASRVKG